MLALPDPIIGLRFRWVLVAVGVVEIVIASACVLAKTKKLATLLVAWLATSFLAYRLGLWWMGWHRPCGCMGSLAGAVHLSDQAADNIMKGVLAYLLVGSYGILLWEWRRGRGRGSGPPAVGGLTPV